MSNRRHISVRQEEVWEQAEKAYPDLTRTALVEYALSLAVLAATGSKMRTATTLKPGFYKVE